MQRRGTTHKINKLMELQIRYKLNKNMKHCYAELRSSVNEP